MGLMTVIVISAPVSSYVLLFPLLSCFSSSLIVLLERLLSATEKFP